MKRLIIISFMLVFIFVLTGCKTINKEDFECLIEVDKSTVKVGDTIKISVSVKNNSNKSVKVKAINTDIDKIEDAILIGIFNELDAHDFSINSKAGPLKSFKFTKNSSIKKDLTYKVDKLNNLEIGAQFCFYNNNELIVIESDFIKIIVEV